MSIEIKLENIFGDIMTPVKVAIFSNFQNESTYQCLYSNTPIHNRDEIISLYNFTPLLRALIQKTNLLSEDIIDQYYQQTDQTRLCYVLDWNEQNRKIIIFDLLNLSFFKKEELSTQLKTHKAQILALVNEIQNNYQPQPAPENRL